MDQNLINTLLNMNVDRMEILAAGAHKDTGVLAKLKRSQLEKLVPVTPLPLGIPTDTLVAMARFTLEFEFLRRDGATLARQTAYAAKSAVSVQTMLDNYNARIATAQARNAAHRSANNMPDITAPENTTTEAAKNGAKHKITGEAKPATGKDAAKPATGKATGKAAKKAAPAKAAKAPAKKAALAKAAKAPKGEGKSAGRPAVKFNGLKIKKLDTDFVPRAGSWTETMFNAVRSSKNTDEVQAKIDAVKEFKGRKPDFNWCVKKGYIELA